MFRGRPSLAPDAAHSGAAKKVRGGDDTEMIFKILIGEKIKRVRKW